MSARNCANQVTAMATKIKNKMASKGRETPLASASSGSKVENNNGLAITANPIKLTKGQK